MPDPDSLIQLILARLERISADSPLAHRASGVRGALLKYLEAQEQGKPSRGIDLTRSIEAAFSILGRAAAAIPARRSPRQ